MSKENYYTNPFALYQELQDYNKNSPLLPPTVLSSKYPTILTDEPIQKNYHALTHANTNCDLDKYTRSTGFTKVTASFGFEY